MEAIILKDFVPVIAGVVGGCLTVFGGLASNYILQHSSRSFEKRKAMREKLEEMYLLCDVISQDSTNSLKELTFAINKQNDDSNQSSPTKPIKKLSMLANIYFPNLVAPVKALEKASGDFAVAAIKRCQEVLESGQKQLDRFSELLPQPYYEVNKCCVELQQAVKNEIKKHL